ncbi:hypothetical protein RQP46_003913 [Phenoliferia psychrophenolica]
MCGILFAIRSSASYHLTGDSPIDSTEPNSPNALPPTSPHSPPTDGPEFGIPLPDGSRAEHLDANETWETMVEAVSSRGPDSHRSIVRHALVQKTYHFEMRFHVSVLHMRGDIVTPQPFEAPNGDVLLWNGEIFDGLAVGPSENDGQVLFDTILREGPTNFFAAIRLVEGPYAFVYYQKLHNRIYFARDPLGRRSLLLHPPTVSSPFLFLSSNGPSVDYPLNQWEEVSCDAVHCYHLNDLKGKSWLVDGKRGLSSYPRYPRSMGLSQDILIYPFDRILPTIPSPTSLIPISPSGTPIMTSELHLTIKNFLRELEASVRKRVAISTVPAFALPTPRIAVLFSGGIDCTTVALLVDRVLPQGEAVDLINVAFENPRKRLRPARRWNLVEVDVPYAEMLAHRPTVIDLMRPNRTVMDLSIAIAFYFAARGQGTIENPIPGGPPVPYQSTARVLLSGLGADELLGGYARHRRAFDKLPGNDWAGLIAELQMDVDRLSHRNLGRDDRIISHWGKEARYPFLAGHVVDFCARTLINFKCDLRFGEGVGDKLLLRLLAKSLGLDGASQLKKRAIHFGARLSSLSRFSL